MNVTTANRMARLAYARHKLDFEAKCLPAKASDAFSLLCLLFISAVPLVSSSIIYQPKEVCFACKQYSVKDGKEETP